MVAVIHEVPVHAVKGLTIEGGQKGKAITVAQSEAGCPDRGRGM